MVSSPLWRNPRAFRVDVGPQGNGSWREGEAQLPPISRGLFPPSAKSKCDSDGRCGRGEWIRKGGAAEPPHPSGEILPSPWQLRRESRNAHAGGGVRGGGP